MDSSSKPPTKRADYYGTFLEAVRQEQAPEQGNSIARNQIPAQRALPPPVAAADGDAAGAEPEPTADVKPVELLKVLRGSGAQSMANLQATTNLRFSRFAEVVGKLEEAGLVVISGLPGSEEVDLSPAGVTLADLG